MLTNRITIARVERAGGLGLVSLLLLPLLAANAAAAVDRVGWTATFPPVTAHAVAGHVTVLDEQTLRVENFTYDGTAPAVYFYLATERSNAGFQDGLELQPQLTRAYNNETVIVTLPPGATIAGYTAISVWCAAFDVDFGSDTFAPPPLPGDGDGDGDVDIADHDLFGGCLAGPGAPPAPGGLGGDACLAAFDFNADGSIALDDYGRVQVRFTGAPAPTAEYRLTFDATWSASTHPTEFPSNPHFSGLVGGTHTHEALFWDIGHLASTGIENMAESGSKTALLGEVQTQISMGTAGSTISGGGIPVSPSMRVITFQISQAYPRATVVSMIAPSPDWFVGVSSLPLLENGAWVDQVVVPLYPYDAGTDSGTTYNSPNQDTDPAEPIYEIMGPPLEVDGSVPPLGTFTFERIN